MSSEVLISSSIESSPEQLNLEHNITNTTDITAPSLQDHEPNSLLDTLEIDSELLKLLSPTKRKPKCLPATYFPSLKNHTPTHSRENSSSALELIQNENVIQQKKDFRIEHERKYSIYVSNDDYEVPESYQVTRSLQINHSDDDSLIPPKIRGKTHRKGSGSFGSLSSLGKLLFHKKSGSFSSPSKPPSQEEESVNDHKSSRSVSLDHVNDI